MANNYLNNADYFILKNRQLIPCDFLTYANWYENNPQERIVSKTKIKQTEISTVYIGKSTLLNVDLPFETMVFGGEYDGEQKRYATFEEAMIGHQKMIEKIDNKIFDWVVQGF